MINKTPNNAFSLENKRLAFPAKEKNTNTPNAKNTSPIYIGKPGACSSAKPLPPIKYPISNTKNSFMVFCEGNAPELE